MKDRFTGDTVRRRLVESLKKHRVVAGNADLAEHTASMGELIDVKAGTAIIEQGGDDTDVYLIVEGSFDIVVNGKSIARRIPGDHVGEMAAIQPNQRRSATVMAHEDSVALKLSQPKLTELCDRHPQILRCFATELARRLEQRNSLVTAVSEKIRVLIISSGEGVAVARTIEKAFEHDSFNVVVWTEGGFRASHYAIESLERALDQSDVAIAIAEGDDVTAAGSEQGCSPRDKVIFELGFLMGRLGRQRTFLVEPRDEKVKLPSDLAGINTITYKHSEAKGLTQALTPACNRLRDVIRDLGPHR
jgi:CRP/FNR family cyclic AMP-dependent transcriptional regulator